MAKNLIITERDDVGGKGHGGNGGGEVIGLELEIFGGPINIQGGISAEQVKLGDIVPLARAISAKIVNAEIEKLREEGDKIPCQEGCSFCCRYLVPVSVPEAFRLMNEIGEKPLSASRAMLERCNNVARHIINRGHPERLIRRNGRFEAEAVANWYANLKLNCPFVHRGMCTIYENRPLACREHFVKGSARGCKGGRGAAEVIEMPVRMPEVLGQLASELEQMSVEAIVLPLVPAWCEANKGRWDRKYPAEAMVERLVEIVEMKAEKNAEAVVA